MIEDKKYEGVDFSKEKFKAEKYSECIFLNCDFSNVHLTEIVFSECVFETCDFSNASLGQTGFREVVFKNCKMLGLHFEHCNDFLLEFRFEDCSLEFSSFYQMKLKTLQFLNCNLSEVDFTETDLTNAVFDNCNLGKTVFVNTLLKKADFRTAYAFSIDPSKNSIAKAKFSKNNIIGLLTKFDIQIEG